MKHATTHQGKRGFTNMDLLIVVVVAALLAGLWLCQPRGGTPYRRHFCTSNLKQISLANILWVNDHENKGLPCRLPLSEGGNNDFSSPAEFRNTAWFQFAWLSNEMSSPKILADPNDKRKSLTLAVAWDNNWNGGFLNAALRDNAVSYGIGIDALVGDGGKLLPIDQAQNHIAFMDRHVEHISRTACSANIGPAWNLASRPANARWLSTVHGSAGGNVALMDGSVQLVTKKGLDDLLKPGDDNGSVHFLFPAVKPGE